MGDKRNRNLQESASLRLTRDAESILDQWEALVLKEIPAAGSSNKELLRNSLPDFLLGISQFISTTSDTPHGERFPNEVIEYSRCHGRRRAENPRYTLDQVIGEYRILRRTILRSLERGGPITEVEREKLLEAIDGGLVESATEFATQRGFQAARVRQVEAEIHEVRGELGQARRQVNSLEAERALRERFVSTLTHDLRTPLTAVMASADLILRRAEDAELVRKLAVKVSEGSDRIDQMIRDLLDANRIEAGEPLPLKIEKCDLRMLTQDTLASLATVYGNRFILMADGDLSGFWSANEIRRAMENLIINGLKYGDPHAAVELMLRDRADFVEVAIHNFGNPISPEHQAILFQPFQRLLSAQLGGKGGWGLGLMLVRGIVQAHGGRVNIDSSASGGTTFTIYLPKDARPFQVKKAA